MVPYPVILSMRAAEQLGLWLYIVPIKPQLLSCCPQRLILSTSMCAGASFTPEFSFLNVTLWLTIWRYRVLSWTHLTCILLVLSVCTCFISIMHSNDIVRFAFVLLLVSQLFENVNVYVNKGLHPWGEGVQTDVSKCKL